MIAEKIAPQLLAMFEDHKRLERTEFAPRYNHLGAVVDNTSKPERVIVFVQCDADADLSNLAVEGIRVNQKEGAVRTAFLPVEKLGRLSDEPAVKRIEPTQQMRFLMDVAADAVQLPQFRQTTGLTGRDVVIGIIDSGIQYRHPAFKVGTGSRVLRIWDQTIFGPGVPEGGYGAELTGQMRDVSRDGDGHGTHVAGIAAGKDPAYGGVAPDARLVIVKTDLNEGHIADGLRYIFRVARELGRPAVVNFSFGGHGGPHDGSDFLSQVIDEQSGPGRIVCCAAGNEGDRALHARVILTQAQQKETRFTVPEDVALVQLNGWFSGQDDVEVALRSPVGFQTNFQAPGAFSQEVLEHLGPPLVKDAVQTIVAGEPWPNGDRYFSISILLEPKGTPSTWTLLLRGNRITTDGQVDVWVAAARAQKPLDSIAFFVDDVHDGVKIGEPATAASAITIASYTTRVAWTDIHDHPLNNPSNLTLHDISSFSSAGPLRRAELKPDVAAPGAWIVSALSADSPFLSLPSSEVAAHLPVDQHHLALQGTSMATPFITGLVALLLEHDPQLDPNGVKQLLRAISSIPGQPAGTFDPKWGYGLIDASKLSALFHPTP